MRPALLGTALLCLALAACGAVGAAKPAPTAFPTLTPEVRGQALFVNRGCGTCHVHSGVGNVEHSIGVGPVLSGYQGDEAFLREWLRNPAALRPGTAMPTIGLTEDEIDALVAFLAP